MNINTERIEHAKLSELKTNTNSEGLLVENILHFARVLRKAGIPVGSGQVLDAVRAVITIGLFNRSDFYWALHSVFVNQGAQREVFDQAFHIFWKNPQILERMMQLMLPEISNSDAITPETEEILKRVVEALSSDDKKQREDSESREIDFDASLTWSAKEVLAEKDFEKMNTEEVRLAIAAVKRIKTSLHEVPTRRYKVCNNGTRIDIRSTFRSILRSGVDFMPLIKRKRRTRRPPLVILCDVSGSMERYSRMLIHFMHAITNDRDRVHTFLFGTRLTNITRFLRNKDVDKALSSVGKATTDWSGGTRIGYSLASFNKEWARRVLGQGAIVILITDGLDREEGGRLGREVSRLHRSCKRLIWLNPLLRFSLKLYIGQLMHFLVQ